MAYNRTTTRGTWFQEQAGLINSASATELAKLNDGFDENLNDVMETMAHNHKNFNIFRDAKRMMENPEIMKEYKELLLDPILDEFRN